jgi:hypothetical protein
MEKYQFIGEWNHISTPPSSGTRCLVCDGELVTIATYIQEGDCGTWMFNELTADVKFKIQGWMNLPKSTMKIVSFNEKSVEED